jgi:hypothetical protein
MSLLKLFKNFQITPVIVERATLNLNVADKRRKPPTQEVRTNFDVLVSKIIELFFTFVTDKGAQISY